MNTDTQPPSTFTLHPAMTLGAVHYTVADLERQIAFYQDLLGFQVHWREGTTAGLGAGQHDLLRLTEQRGARRVQGTTGLYHTAFLLPTTWELANLLKQIAVTRTPIQGMVNHRTHYAIYLPDAEGNGIELAWDFPKAQWPPLADMLKLGNLPLEPETLFDELDRNPTEWKGLDPASRVGHVHLHVADLNRAKGFYSTVLGLDTLFVEPRMGAAFFSAGGYHHHLGTNLWQGVGAPPPPADATGLRHYTIVLPDGDEVARVVAQVKAAGIATEEVANGVKVLDPFQNGIVLTSDAAAV
jgi:catechol 2,3-dioxygenase